MFDWRNASWFNSLNVVVGFFPQCIFVSRSHWHVLYLMHLHSLLYTMNLKDSLHQTCSKPSPLLSLRMNIFSQSSKFYFSKQHSQPPQKHTFPTKVGLITSVLGWFQFDCIHNDFWPDTRNTLCVLLTQVELIHAFEWRCKRVVKIND